MSATISPRVKPPTFITTTPLIPGMYMNTMPASMVRILVAAVTAADGTSYELRPLLIPSRPPAFTNRLAEQCNLILNATH